MRELDSAELSVLAGSDGKKPWAPWPGAGGDVRARAFLEHLAVCSFCRARVEEARSKQ